MSNGYGYEREPQMDKPSYNRRFSKKRAGLRRERNKKLRHLPLTEDARSHSKIYSGWEW